MTAQKLQHQQRRKSDHWLCEQHRHGKPHSEHSRHDYTTTTAIEKHQIHKHGSKTMQHANKNSKPNEGCNGK